MQDETIPEHRQRQGARRPWFPIDRPSETSVPYGYCQCGCGELAPIARQTRSERGQIAGQPTNYCRGHNNRGRSPYDLHSYDIVDLGYASPCWRYAREPASFGYCQIRMPDGSIQMAHRAFYEQEYGPIPGGMTLDHLCHTDTSACAGGRLCEHRRCVNPRHMEVVSRGDNARRRRGVMLDAGLVREIRVLLEGGQCVADIARIYDVGVGSIYHIKRGTAWADV